MPNPLCPNCEKSPLRAWRGRVHVMGIEVDGSGLRCGACEETVFDFAEVERQERDAAHGLVARGIRTAAEFKFVRKLSGLRANELAEMLDVRPETVSRWERGEVEIPRAVAYALGEYFEHPRITRQKLEAFAR